jgi:hypothetical protein
MATLQKRYSAATTAAGRDSARSNDAYVSRLTNFNPTEYLRQGVQAGMDQIGEDFAESEAARAESLNSRGLFQSNLGGGRATRDLNTRIARELASRSSEAARMELAATGELGAHARHTTGSYYDLLAGEMDREEAQKNAKRSRWRSLAGGLGTLAGGLIGSVVPGAGTMVGARIGGALGGAAGDFFGGR